MFDAVIFDWDGTLADTQEVVVHSFQTVLKEIGCEVRNEFLERQIGIGAKNMFKNTLKSKKMSFNDKFIDKLLAEKNQIHLELAQDIKLFEGVVNLLDSIFRKVKIALATMSSREVIDNLLIRTDIQKYFNYVVTADEVQEPKPSSEIFLKCATLLQCIPENCVVVEDSIYGIIAAKKAKMKCIAVASGAYSKEALEDQKPDLVVNSLKEKTKILEFIFLQ